MLLSFRFANHRSFRDEQQLNLMPVYESDDSDDGAGPAAAPVVAIFGANASGKSNVISAFNYVRRMAGQSDRESEPGRGPRREPFRLDPEVAARSSSYAVDLLLYGVRHTYGFTLDDRQVAEEWLYSYPLRRKRVVFERSGQDFSWGEESGRSPIRRSAEIVAPTALFLSVSARFDPHGATEGSDETAASLHETFSWLWQRMLSAGTGEISQQVVYRDFITNPGRQDAIISLLRAADVGLRDLVVQLPDIDEAVKSYAARHEIPEESVRRGLTDSLLPDGRLGFLHQGAKGSVTFDAADESAGTMQLLALAVSAVSVLDSGGLFLVDEIDASLHPLLTANLIGMFQSPGVNKRQAQLVFTTHDATLLGSIDGEDILQRDQVWFTSKDDAGVSELFPLSEFKPRRQGENRQKRYLNGSYGAIPEISMDLFEQALTSRMDRDAG